MCSWSRRVRQWLTPSAPKHPHSRFPPARGCHRWAAFQHTQPDPDREICDRLLTTTTTSADLASKHPEPQAVVSFATTAIRPARSAACPAQSRYQSWPDAPCRLNRMRRNRNDFWSWILVYVED